jgi:excisionase family DNA binding protein
MRKKIEPNDISLNSQTPSVLGSSSSEGTGSAVSCDSDDRLLGIDEAAELLGLSKGGLYHLVSARRIDVVRISSRCIRFSRRALREWIESLTQKAEKLPSD